MTISFIGDLSNADVNVLAELASKSHRILEFGSGGSTQIFAQCAPPGSRILSVDTSQEWMNKAAANLGFIFGAESNAEFVKYDIWREKVDSRQFDLIFDDGVDDLRLEFAKDSWPMLRVGGLMVFHDTRREADIDNVLALIQANYLEVAEAQFNVQSSNLTVIRKKVSEPWVNWNVVQGREPWEYGAAEPPANWPR